MLLYFQCLENEHVLMADLSGTFMDLKNEAKCLSNSYVTKILIPCLSVLSTGILLLILLQ